MYLERDRYLSVLIVIIEMMIVMVVMIVVMEICWWGQVRNKNVGTILSVPVLLICDLSSDTFVFIVVIATVVAIIINVYVHTF